MKHHGKRVVDSMLTTRALGHAAAIGGVVAGSVGAREWCLRGFDSVVPEARSRQGGLGSSLGSRVERFDGVVLCIRGATRSAAHAMRRCNEMPALGAWSVAATPADEHRRATTWKMTGEDADITQTLKRAEALDVPSMVAFSDAVARPLKTRLCTAIVQAVRCRGRGLARLKSGRPAPLQSDREFQGGLPERIAGMHGKSRHPTAGHQRRFVVARARWSWSNGPEEAEGSLRFGERHRLSTRRRKLEHVLGAHR